MLGLGVNAHLLAASLRGVIAQHLVRRICTQCAEALEGTEVLNLFNDVADLVGGNGSTPLHQGRGCETCRYTGYRDRTALFEMLICNSAIRGLIERKATPDAIEAQAIQDGMVPLRQSAKLLVAQGTTTLEEAMRILDLQT
jgi:type II secretory ATPase GspE/PulE/Tfp pilus assembly ATPase PilB-like protein